MKIHKEAVSGMEVLWTSTVRVILFYKIEKFDESSGPNPCVMHPDSVFASANSTSGFATPCSAIQITQSNCMCMPEGLLYNNGAVDTPFGCANAGGNVFSFRCSTRRLHCSRKGWARVTPGVILARIDVLSGCSNERLDRHAKCCQNHATNYFQTQEYGIPRGTRSVRDHYYGGNAKEPTTSQGGDKVEETPNS